MNIIKKQLEDGLTVDLSRGIYPFIGAEESLSVRNGTAISTDDGLPGTGVFTMKKAAGSDTPVMLFIAVLIVAGFAMLTLAAMNADYSVAKFIGTFFSAKNLIYLALFIAINAFAVFWVYKYKDLLCRRYLRYEERLDNEHAAVSEAAESSEGVRKEILSGYARCLELEKELLETETLLNALQLYSGARYAEAAERFRERFSDLQKRLNEIRFKTDAGADERKRACFHNLCQSFEILYTESRFWDISGMDDPFKGHRWHSTVFCTGMFDYALSCSYPPIMKAKSGTLYIYSEFAVLARSTTDFDVVPLKDLTMEFSHVPGNVHFGVLRIPELELAFTSSDPYNLELFVREFTAYRDGKSDPGGFHQLDSLLEETAFYYIIRRKVTSGMIQNHFGIGKTRTRRILTQLEQLGIVSARNTDGMRELLVWDIEKVRSLIKEKSKEYLD